MPAKHSAILLCLAPLLGVHASWVQADTQLTGIVRDSDTKQPIAARVYVQSVKTNQWHFVEPATPDGQVVIYDKMRSANSVERHTSVSAHRFQVMLPAGEYQITIEQGKEYLPSQQTLIVKDQPISREFLLQRWSRVSDRGWYSGDTHVHRTMEELPIAMLAEDLNVALPLNYWVTKSHTPPTAGDKNIGGNIGSQLIKVDPTHVIHPMNTEYEIFSVNGKRHTLGAVFVLNHQQKLEIGVPPVTPVMQEARKQGALLDLDKHSWPWSLMLVPTMNVDLFELTNNHIWRTNFHFNRWTKDVNPDGWDIETDENGWTEWGWIDFGFKCYYALLNCGFEMRPSAGTASGVHPVPLGFGRVYVQVEKPFTYQKWIKGLDAGRSFVTTGPMLEVTFNEQSPGTKFNAQETLPYSMKVEGTCTYYRPVTQLDIIVNGGIVKSLKPQAEKLSNGAFRYRFEYEHTVTKSSWITVRGLSKKEDRIRFAHSAPVHVTVPGKPLRPKRREVRYFVRRMQQEIARNKSVLDAKSLEEYKTALQAFQKLEEKAE